ncbi:hypothetical protein PAXINDRAFT_13910 [Paxillus involutus ATCC 200175]|uniref:Uncharacterized protein n=1 Tax=Paxillus involutus ATCC 200175 TaxID=664439 RepID=A0A0C9U1L8_PAXIN|nr:hypothetical protein PAXINDRAFT_13910 [Paxillus involutus ATCC 200175]
MSSPAFPSSCSSNLPELPKVEAAGASNAVVDALRSTPHQKLTTNAAPAFDSTLMPTLYAFLGLDTYLQVTGRELGFMLGNAWAEDLALALRIIWNARSIHDGKVDKELSTEPSPHGRRKPPLPGRPDVLSSFTQRGCKWCCREALLHLPREYWSRAQRVQPFANAHDRLTRKLLDKRYLALYVAVARLFAVRLTKDFTILEKIAALPGDTGEKERMKLMGALSLAPKWAPTPGGSHDRVTNISSAICLLLHHAQTLPAPEMHLLRWFYQRHVLTPGRRYNCVPEPLMSANRWSEIAYSRVPSVCMHANKEKFFTHGAERFVSYLTDVESGKKQIGGATLLPHLLVMQAVELALAQKETPTRYGSKKPETQALVVDAQWATLLARLRKAGEWDNCIAVCDVSGSMGSMWETILPGKSPFEVDPVWPALSFPRLGAARETSICGFVHHVLFTTSRGRPGSGIQNDLNAVFLKLILPLAIKHKVPQDEMIKRVFLFSDMQFDCASTEYDPSDWKTNHDVVERAYQEAGYDVPEIVYWNLSRESITAPVTGEREGVALLSEYSPSLLKVFMDVEEEDFEVLDDSGEKVKQKLTPEEIMRKVLGRRSYNGLVVVD